MCLLIGSVYFLAFKVAGCFNGCRCTHAGGGHHLAVGPIHHLASRKDAWDAGVHHGIRHNDAVLIHLKLAFEHIGSGEDVQAAHAESEQLQALYAAIEQLPVLPRTVLSLHYRDGLQISEIADMLDCPEGTIKSHLNRGRSRLKAALAQRESHYARL